MLLITRRYYPLYPQTKSRKTNLFTVTWPFYHRFSHIKTSGKRLHNYGKSLFYSWVNPYSSIRFTGDHRAFSLADAQTMYSPEMDRWSTGSNHLCGSEKISALWRLEHWIYIIFHRLSYPTAATLALSLWSAASSKLQNFETSQGVSPISPK